jgi:hypothetical protein
MEPSSSKKKDKRSMPFEDTEGEEAFELASRIVYGRRPDARKATPKRGRGSTGPISGRGSRSAANLVKDDGGTEGKTIPIELESPPRLGEIDKNYIKSFRGNPTKRAPTKYDHAYQIHHETYDGLGVQVKIVREENPYLHARCAAIDYRFRSPFHYDFYNSVIRKKGKILVMKWIDWEHLERNRLPVSDEVLRIVDDHGMRDIMGFSYDWNIEIIGQFHATFHYEDRVDIIHWMTEGVHYKVDFTTFARLLGFGEEDKMVENIIFENYMKGKNVPELFECEELAGRMTVGLKPIYYALNNLLRETINPKGDSDATPLRKYVVNQLKRMMPGSKPFFVSKYIWFGLITTLDDGRNNFPYAPYMMYVIEMVSGLRFPKDYVHKYYQLAS